MNHPKSVIGGDFFWHYEIDSYNILFALVDCTGHAISGSLISILANDNLNRIVCDFEVTEPADIYWLIDRQMLETNKSESNSLEAAPGMEILLCNLDLKKRRLRFSGARRPVYLIRDSKLEIHIG
jgi:serine phosphatase RsbU (regulator of sigma subunit)